MGSEKPCSARRWAAGVVLTLIVGLVLLLVLLGLTLVAQGARTRTLVIKGSDTMVGLSQAWAEAFMTRRPGASVAVTGGGSGTGIAAFLNGTCDIANASRPMSAKEIEQAKQRNQVPRATVCALDGLAVAVNVVNPIQDIDLAALFKVYRGRATDWSALGGTGGGVVALARESNSGTHVYFKERVLGGASYGSRVLFLPSTKSIQQEVSSNPLAIGYGGEAYFKGQARVKILPLIAQRGESVPVYPTEANVRSRAYPLSRELYMYTAGSPRGLAAEFIRFCLSPEGQQIVRRIGYVPLRG